MPKENQPQKDIYQLIDQYLTRRNIIIACIVIIALIIGLAIWNYLGQSTINLSPNVTDYQLQITSSPQPFTREKSPDSPEKIITQTTANTKFQTKVKAGQYYLIEVSKTGYSQYQYSFLAETFATYDLTPQLFAPAIDNYIKFPNYNPTTNQIFFINSPDNYLTALDLETNQKEILEDKSWYGVEEIIFSPDHNRAILKVRNDNITFSGGYFKTDLEDPAQTRQSSPTSVFYQPTIPNDFTTTWVFDRLNKQYHYLDQNIKNTNWINNDTIVYEYSNFNNDAYGNPDFVLNNSINLAHFDGTAWQSVYNLANTNLGLSKIIPSPTNPDQIMLLPVPFETGTEIKTTAHLLNLKTQEVIQITPNGIAEASWSPDGQHILFAKLDPEHNNQPTLWITDLSGTNQYSLEINTLVSKTTWLDNVNIVAAVPIVPTAIPANYYRQPDFPTLDALYQININTKQATNLFVDNYQYLTQIHHLLTNDQNIYFQDESNKLFYLIRN
ncbi:MAG: hypothetical protein WC570_00010 [Patescibacteria group bacterium]